MKTNKKTISKQINLLGEYEFSSFLKLQANYVIANTGGVQPWYFSDEHKKRLVSTINILDSKELTQVVIHNYKSTN